MIPASEDEGCRLLIQQSENPKKKTSLCETVIISVIIFEQTLRVTLGLLGRPLRRVGLAFCRWIYVFDWTCSQDKLSD